MTATAEAIDLDSVSVSLEALDLISGHLARRLGVLPLVIADRVLLAVADDPEDLSIADQLEDITGYAVRLYPPAPGCNLDDAIREYYPSQPARAATDTAQAGRIFYELLSRAARMRASDIHIFPTEKGADLQFRIDSDLAKARELSLQEASELISYVKILGKMNIAEQRQPLDGSAEVAINGGKLNLRIATMPTIYGERMAIRLLSDVVFAELSGLHTLGFDEKQLELLRQSLTLSQGMIYLSGPTGSGKTTTLYSMLKELQQGGTRHILTVEDPVENIIPGITQVSVDSEGERMRFHKILRSVLRHDPDIILIGETRDEESASVAINSAMTGHLVLSTVHANSSIAVVDRLLELGVERSLLAGLLSASVAQRLLRRPCRHCSRQRELTSQEKKQLGHPGLPRLLTTEAPGCVFCRQQGSSGRIGIFEILQLNEKAAALIGNRDVPTFELSRRLKPDRTLLDDALFKCHRGQTLLREVLTLAGHTETA